MAYSYESPTLSVLIADRLFGKTPSLQPHSRYYELERMMAVLCMLNQSSETGLHQLFGCISGTIYTFRQYCWVKPADLTGELLKKMIYNGIKEFDRGLLMFLK